MKCLVTGGAGFIGSSLARSLLHRGASVRILDDFSSGNRANLTELAGDFEVIEGNIGDEVVMARAVQGIEVVFHLAAVVSVPRSIAEPVENHAVNATGTLKVLEAARRAGVRRVVYSASAAAYGNDLRLPKVETMLPAPVSPYGASKLAGELYSQVYAAAFSIETVCLRYFNVFGPRQDPHSEYAAVIPKFITSALAGDTPVIFGDGTQSRDFCYIDNVVQANYLAAVTDGVSGQLFNIACGTAVTLNELVTLIGQSIGRPVRARHDGERPGDIKHSLADISKARAGLGYEASVSFAEGLRHTIDWYSARH